MHNACIISFFMKNIDTKTVDLQHRVVDKFNKSKYPHYSILTDLRHGASMDFAWSMNGITHSTFKEMKVEKKFDFDIILFLDIDCLPLWDGAIDEYISKASEGRLVGNIQRSNHIQNNEHVFVAPSALALSVDSFLTMDKPTALETSRADVAEEYTFAAEKVGIPIDYYMPLRYDEAPAECPFWKLKEGMPVYGRGTTFGVPVGVDQNGPYPEQPYFWHQFQSFHPGQQEKFWKKCEELLSN